MQPVPVGVIAHDDIASHPGQNAMTAARPPLIGPILILDNIGDGTPTLSVLFIVDGGAPAARRDSRRGG